MKQKKVVIVNDGVFKESKPSYYTMYINALKSCLKTIKLPQKDAMGVKISEIPATTVLVVENTDEARKLLAAGKIDAVIFVSCGMYQLACDLLSDYPELNVLVISGTAVQGQPFVIPKEMVNIDGIEAFIRQM